MDCLFVCAQFVEEIMQLIRLNRTEMALHIIEYIYYKHIQVVWNKRYNNYIYLFQKCRKAILQYEFLTYLHYTWNLNMFNWQEYLVVNAIYLKHISYISLCFFTNVISMLFKKCCIIIRSLYYLIFRLYISLQFGSICLFLY